MHFRHLFWQTNFQSLSVSQSIVLWCWIFDGDANDESSPPFLCNTWQMWLIEIDCEYLKWKERSTEKIIRRNSFTLGRRGRITGKLPQCSFLTSTFNKNTRMHVECCYHFCELRQWSSIPVGKWANSSRRTNKVHFHSSGWLLRDSGLFLATEITQINYSRHPPLLHQG